MNGRKTPLLALLLSVPVASIAVLMSMIIAPGSIGGRAAFLISKIWLLLLPLLWTVLVDRQKLSYSKPANGGFEVAVGFGILASIAVVCLYLTAGRFLIAPAEVKKAAAEVGLSNPYIYLAGAGYWILINSVLEEYLWRWFVVKQSRKLMPASLAAVISAVCFTFHHVLALAVYFDWPVVLTASFGVFAGGFFWALMYLRYRSIWPGYVSHVIVDIAVFAVGYHLIFC